MNRSTITTNSTRAVVAALACILPTVLIGTDGQVARAEDPIPDESLPAATVAADPLVSERTERLQAGVVGSNENNDSFPNTDIRVAAFAEIADTIYVGGKFTQVEVAATGVRHNQSFLAAFDRNTGAWDDTFRPTLDGNVWDLKATDDGRLIVAGQFTNVDGAPNTSSIAMLDTTGAVDPTWRVDLTLTGSSQRALARTLDIEGDDLYIGGNFTRITGSNGDTKNAGRIARVNVSTGNADGAFLPNIDGVVFDIDATADRVYVVGNFHYVNGVWSIGEVPLQPGNGQIVPGLQPYVRTYLGNTHNSYQQAIISLGDEVWQAGAQHSTQVYRSSDYQLLRSFVSHPWGDGQALTRMNGIVYKGSHANDSTFEYADTTIWPKLTDYTTRKPVRWMGAWDASIGGAHDHLTWYPQVGTEHGEGSWELFADSTDCLWAGGDFNRGSYDDDVARYVGGFAKFCAADSTAPEPPTSPSAQVVNDGVTLAWQPSAGDDRGGPVRYELLKNDSVFASYISITTFRDPAGTADDRYFVRAMDSTGNRSTTTQIFSADAAEDTTRPSTPADLGAVLDPTGDVTLTWTDSTDDTGVTGYAVLRNGVEIATVTAPTHVVPVPDSGDHWYQVRAIDAAGNESANTPPILVTIDADDVTKPTVPTDLIGEIEPDGDVSLTWTPSTDNVGVDSYIVFRNGEVLDTVPDPTALVVAPTSGDHYYQVQAVDAAGNESFKTPPTQITIAGVDVTRPSTPQELSGTVEAAGHVTLTWAASNDDVAVTEYIAFRNGVEVARVDGAAPDPTVTIIAAPLGTGWFQVRAVDAASNESFKTPPVEIRVLGPDTSKPTTPGNLGATVDANGDIALSWTPATDDVGVVSYLVLRNGDLIDTVTVPAALFVSPPAGASFIQVQAVDAAGNESSKTPPTRIDI